MLLFAVLLPFGLLAFANTETYKCSNGENSDELRSLYLNYHNDARRRVAKGEEGNLNPAKNMYKLAWSCEMEKKAQEIISTCSGGISNLGSYAGNTITFTGSGFRNPRQLIEQTLKSWWSKARQMTDKENRYTNRALYTFANMIFSKTTEIGCAHKVCSNRMQIMCLYNEVGFFNNNVLWETGKACATAENCQTYKSTACENGLCVRASEKPDTGESNQCTGADGMTDAIRNTFLDKNNEYRSLTANGKAKDGKQGYAPKAAKMLKLKYDCNLEAMAMKHAKKCRYAHSDYPGLGENIFKMSIPNYDKKRAAGMASDAWFSELKDFGVGQENIYNDALTSRPGTQIGHYTQMVWQNTATIGCAVRSCTGMTLVSCNYKPPGNYGNQLIYEKGEPCSRCPRNSKCENGLCVV